MKKIYERCKELLEKHFKKGDKVGAVKLTELIMLELGSDPRTIQNSLRTMMKLKLIKDINNCHWKIL